MKGKNGNINRIQHVSSMFRFLFTALIYFIPVVTLMYWLLFNHLPAGFTADLPVVVNQTFPLSLLF